MLNRGFSFVIRGGVCVEEDYKLLGSQGEN